MTNLFKTMLWNANGLLKHQNDLEIILNSEKIDICLISETHFTKESYFSLPNFVTYHTIHPNNCARGGAAIIIKKSIKHFEDGRLSTNEFQAITISINCGKNLSLTAVYSPPRHKITCDQYLRLINNHKHGFIMGGDFNAKHTHWGSRIITTKGRELYKALQSTGCSTLSTGAPTYWPTDPQKIPDLIDFFITRNFSSEYMRIESGLDLNSDHSPIYLTIHKSVITKEPQFTLTNKYTDWDYFRKILSDDKDNPEINSNEALDDEVLNLSNSIQRAAWRSTPATRTISAGHKYTREIKEMVREKRKARRRWQQSRSPPDKITLNKITKELSKKIKAFKNRSHSDYLKRLTNEHSTDYSLWKCAK